MRTVSPPGELLTEVAQGLLGAAERLGLPATVVATTTSAQFGYGCVVPDEVFDAWFLTRGEAGGAPVRTVELPTFPGVTEDLEHLAALDPGGTPEESETPEVPEEPEVPETPEVPEVPEVPEESAPKPRKRGTAKAATDEKEA